MSDLLEITKIAKSENNIVSAVHEVFKCVHVNHKLVYKTDSNEATSFYYQCLKCGEKIQRIGKIGVQKMIDKGIIKDEEIEKFDESIMRKNRDRQQFWYQEASRIRQEASQVQEENRIKLQKEAYADYMQSAQWRAKRLATLDRDSNWCQGCRNALATEVHHLTYERFGNEMIFDLTSVCYECHMKIHPKKAQAPTA